METTNLTQLPVCREKEHEANYGELIGPKKHVIPERVKKKHTHIYIISMPHIQYDVFGLGRKYQAFKKKEKVVTCSDGILFLTIDLQLYLFCFLNLMTGWN